MLVFDKICNYKRGVTMPAKSGQRWSEDDLGFLKKKGPKLETDEIAKKLGRTENAIRDKAYREGISLMPKDKKQ